MKDKKNIISLNPEQIKAINTIEGNLLIIASAGTGKTTTIVERYLNLVNNHGIKPQEVMMTTFTNKASKDMINKIAKRTKKIPYYIGTMHSIFLNILRKEGDRVLTNKDFLLLTDEHDKKKIIKEILKKEDIEPTRDNLMYFMSWISRFKNRGILAKDLSLDITMDEMRESGIIEEVLDDEVIHVNPYLREQVNKIYKLYQDHLKQHNLLDFDEILLLTFELFSKDTETLQRYKAQFKHIIVDEAQDLNLVQIRILKLLHEDNLCLIGDDCQNIYEWRGSSNELVFDFHENKNKVFLKENYRSTDTIIKAVNKTIESMSFKIEKQLTSTRVKGEKINIECHPTMEDEADSLIEKIVGLIDKGDPLDEIAILSRTNNIGKFFEKRLRKMKIPCHLSKSRSFFEREEIKDFLSFLRLKVNPNSYIDFERIIKLLEGFGPAKIEKLMIIAKKNKTTLVGSLEHIKELNPNNTQITDINNLKSALLDYTNDHFDQFTKQLRYYDIIEKKYLKEPRKIEEKIENLEILEELIKEYSKDKEGIKQFLDSLIDLEKKERSKNKITISTIHSAKGLEWKNVFLVSCNERILPFYTKELRKVKRDSELRLFYVAISRAKDNLNISYSFHNGWKDLAPSQFLEIIEDDPGYTRLEF